MDRVYRKQKFPQVPPGASSPLYMPRLPSTKFGADLVTFWKNCENPAAFSDDQILNLRNLTNIVLRRVQALGIIWSKFHGFQKVFHFHTQHFFKNYSKSSAWLLTLTPGSDSNSWLRLLTPTPDSDSWLHMLRNHQDKEKHLRGSNV